MVLGPESVSYWTPCKSCNMRVTQACELWGSHSVSDCELEYSNFLSTIKDTHFFMDTHFRW